MPGLGIAGAGEPPLTPTETARGRRGVLHRGTEACRVPFLPPPSLTRGDVVADEVRQEAARRARHVAQAQRARARDAELVREVARELELRVDGLRVERVLVLGVEGARVPHDVAALRGGGKGRLRCGRRAHERDASEREVLRACTPRDRTGGRAVRAPAAERGRGERGRTVHVEVREPAVRRIDELRVSMRAGGRSGGSAGPAVAPMLARARDARARGPRVRGAHWRPKWRGGSTLRSRCSGLEKKGQRWGRGYPVVAGGGRHRSMLTVVDEAELWNTVVADVKATRIKGLAHPTRQHSRSTSSHWFIAIMWTSVMAMGVGTEFHRLSFDQSIMLQFADTTAQRVARDTSSHPTHTLHHRASSPLPVSLTPESNAIVAVRLSGENCPTPVDQPPP